VLSTWYAVLCGHTLPRCLVHFLASPSAIWREPIQLQPVQSRLAGVNRIILLSKHAPRVVAPIAQASSLNAPRSLSKRPLSVGSASGHRHPRRRAGDDRAIDTHRGAQRRGGSRSDDGPTLRRIANESAGIRRGIARYGERCAVRRRRTICLQRRCRGDGTNGRDGRHGYGKTNAGHLAPPSFLHPHALGGRSRIRPVAGRCGRGVETGLCRCSSGEC
jgi:hypothetical protein